jgi:Tol biopolymer transport system component
LLCSILISTATSALGEEGVPWVRTVGGAVRADGSERLVWRFEQPQRGKAQAWALGTVSAQGQWAATVHVLEAAAEPGDVSISRDGRWVGFGIIQDNPPAGSGFRSKIAFTTNFEQKEGGRPKTRTSAMQQIPIAQKQLVVERSASGKTAPQALSEQPGDQTGLAFSPDGKAAACALFRGGRWCIALTTLADRSERLLAPTAQKGNRFVYEDIVFSPSGNELWYTSREGGRAFICRLLLTDSSPKTTVALRDPAADCSMPALSPDGAQVTYVVGGDPNRAESGRPGGAIWTANVDGSAARLVSKPGAGEDYGYPAFSDDGQTVLFTRTHFAAAQRPTPGVVTPSSLAVHSLCRVPVAGGDVKVIVEDLSAKPAR